MAEYKIAAVRTDGFEMDHLKFGHGDKTFVILPGASVQSVMGSAEAVVDAYSSMAEDFTVFLFDRRKDVPESYSLKDMARDTERAIRAAGLEHASIFGASQGGMIAMQIAANAPDLVDKLVLGSTCACVNRQKYMLFEHLNKLAEDKNAAELYRVFGETLFPKEVFDQIREGFIDSSKSVTDDELDQFIILTETMRDFDFIGGLGSIRCPVLVIGDTDDQVFGSDASVQIWESLKSSRDPELYIYEGYGHSVYDLAPDYKERMLRFLL